MALVMTSVRTNRKKKMMKTMKVTMMRKEVLEETRQAEKLTRARTPREARLLRKAVRVV